MRLVSIVVIFGVIGGWASASADTSSQIEPKKLGADSIVNETLKCRDSAMAAQPDTKRVVALGHCFCMIDYARKQSGDSNVKFWTFMEKLDPAKLSGPFSACADWAVKHQDDKTQGDSPYSSKLDLSTHQIYGASQGCQARTDGLGLTAMQRAGMCACVADTMRTLPRTKVEQLSKKARAGGETASALPQDKIEFCSKKWEVK